MPNYYVLETALIVIYANSDIVNEVEMVVKGDLACTQQSGMISESPC